jgi:hypothetical protein
MHKTVLFVEPFPKSSKQRALAFAQAGYLVRTALRVGDALMLAESVRCDVAVVGHGGHENEGVLPESSDLNSQLPRSSTFTWGAFTTQKARTQSCK